MQTPSSRRDTGRDREECARRRSSRPSDISHHGNDRRRRETHVRSATSIRWSARLSADKNFATGSRSDCPSRRRSNLLIRSQSATQKHPWPSLPMPHRPSLRARRMKPLPRNAMPLVERLRGMASRGRRFRGKRRTPCCNTVRSSLVSKVSGRRYLRIQSVEGIVAAIVVLFQPMREPVNGCANLVP